MANRARVRVGKFVFYTPIAAEAAADGAGPWIAQIVDLNQDGSVTLRVWPRKGPTTAAALASPLITSADASDLPTAQTLANELKADVNIMTTLVNQLRSYEQGRVKTQAKRGSGLGQWDFTS